MKKAQIIVLSLLGLVLGLAAKHTPLATTCECPPPLVVVLDNAAIKSLPSTAFALIPAPGPGKAIKFFGASMVRHNVIEYGNIAEDVYGVFSFGQDNVELSSYLGPVVMTGPILGAGADQNFDIPPYRFVDDPLWGPQPNHYYVSDLVNQSLLFYVSNSVGDFTGGDPANTLTITVYYLVVDVY